MLWLMKTALAAPLTLLQQGPLLADGHSEAEVLLQLPGVQADGKLRLSLRGGRLISQALEGHDLVRVRLRPNALERPSELELSVRYRGDFELDQAVTIEALPPASGALEIHFASPITRAGGAPITLQIRPSGVQHLPLAARSLRLAASHGSVTQQPIADDQGWTARWAPPSSARDPIPVVFTVTDLTAPASVYGAAVLPLSVSRSLSQAGDALLIGDRQLAPDPAGGFRFQLSPAETQASLLRSDPRGKTVRVAVDLQNTSLPSACLAPLPAPYRVPADHPVQLRVFAVDALGRPWDDAVGLGVSSPGDPELEALGGGWYQVEVAPQPSDWYARASLGGLSQRQEVAPLPPAEAPTLDAPDALTGEAFRVPAGVRVTGADSALRNGALQVRPGDSGLVTLTRFSPTPATGLPVARLRAWAPASWGYAGRDSLALLVVAEDALGVPVPDVSLSITVSGEDTPPLHQTTRQGLAVVALPLGPTPGPALVTVTAGALSSTVPLWRLRPGEVAPPLLTAHPHPAALSRVLRGPAPKPEPVVVVEEVEVVKTPPDTGSASESEASAPTAEAVGQPDAPIQRDPAPAQQIPRPASAPDDRGRLRLGLGMAGQRFDQRADDPELLPPLVSYVDPLFSGAVALQLGGELRLFSQLQADLQLDWQRRRLQIGGDTLGNSVGSWRVGARWLQPVGPLALGGGAWVQRTNVTTLGYNPDRSGVSPLQRGVGGLALGALAQLDLGPVRGELRLAETLAPRPVVSELGLRLEWALPLELGGLGLLAQLGWDAQWRHLSLDQRGASVVLRDQLQVLHLGSGLRF